MTWVLWLCGMVYSNMLRLIVLLMTLVFSMVHRVVNWFSSYWSGCLWTLINNSSCWNLYALQICSWFEKSYKTAMLSCHWLCPSYKFLQVKVKIKFAHRVIDISDHSFRKLKTPLKCFLTGLVWNALGTQSLWVL
jgi:hypothetical protein